MRFFSRKLRSIVQGGSFDESRNAPVVHDESSEGETMTERRVPQLYSSTSVPVFSTPRDSAKESDKQADDDVLLELSTSSVLSNGERGFLLAFEGVSIETRSCLRLPRSLLSDVSGIFSPGSIAVILSADPHCSRKLLEVLAGAEERASGTVMANALPSVSAAYRRRVALIKTTDVCSRDATVRENLLFSVRMRVETRHEDRLVCKAAAGARLTDCLDTRAARLTRPQQYALAVAMELVKHPLVLALEEPLRGLSHGDVHALVTALQSLAAGGRLVLVSAAEMPRALFEAAASLVLLDARGRAIYSGPKADALAFLRESAGIENADGEVLGELLATLEETEQAARVAGVFAKSPEHQSVLQQVEEHRRNTALNRYESFPRAAVPAPGYCRRWLLLTAYTCRRATIGVRSFVIAWSILLLLFFVMAMLIVGSNSDQNAMQNKRGVIFFLLSCSMHVNTILIDAEVREFFSGVHLRNNDYFDTMQYFTATVLRLIIPRVVFPICGAICGFFILGSYLSLVIVLMMGLTSLAHASITILLVYWHPVSRDLWIAQNIYHGYCIILSGFLICLPTVPKIFSAFSILRYGYGGVVSLVLRDNPFSCDAKASVSYCYTGNQYLEMEGFANDSWEKSAIFLFILSLVILTLVAVSMKLIWPSHIG